MPPVAMSLADLPEAVIIARPPGRDFSRWLAACSAGNHSISEAGSLNCCMALGSIASHADDVQPKPETVLIVDGDDATRCVLRALLREGGYATIDAATAATARTRLIASEPDVALIDIGLLDGSGLDLAQVVLEECPDVAVIMVSVTDDPLVAHSAVDLGAFGCIAKPFSPNTVLVAVHNAVRRRDLERGHREQRDALTHLIDEQTGELRAAAAQLAITVTDAGRSQDETVARLSRAIGYRDPETAGHVMRMGHLCGRLAHAFGLDEETARTAGSMHDIGKIGVPDAVLLKPGPLDADERRSMERHTVIGHDLLSGSGTALLDLAATIALSHHERWDGSGYPSGLRGTEIPLAGRIAAVADVFDAITTPRVYRPQVLSRTAALDYIRAQRGRHFDPAVVAKLSARL
jgi:putative two-component system response regulator